MSGQDKVMKSYARQHDSSPEVDGRALYIFISSSKGVSPLQNPRNSYSKERQIDKAWLRDGVEQFAESDWNPELQEETVCGYPSTGQKLTIVIAFVRLTLKTKLL